MKFVFAPISIIAGLLAGILGEGRRLSPTDPRLLEAEKERAAA